MKTERIYMASVVVLVAVAVASSVQMRMSAARHHEIIQRKAESLADRKSVV